MFYRIRIGTAIAVLLACSPATSGAVSVGDAVLEWNQIAVTRTLNATPAQAPVEQTRTMAIVQVSVHDAISGITGQYETYSSPGPAPANASPVAAAIAAAHHALRALFPDHAGTLDGNYAGLTGDPWRVFDGSRPRVRPIRCRRHPGAALERSCVRSSSSTTPSRAREHPAYGSASEGRRHCCRAGAP